MSVAKCLTVTVLVLSSQTNAAFVKKYLEAKLLAQMLNNVQMPDSSMMSAYGMMPKPEESFNQMALPWRMRLRPTMESEAAHQAHLYGPGHFHEHPVDGHHHDSHFDFPSQEELRAVMMKTPPSAATMMMMMGDSVKSSSMDAASGMPTASFPPMTAVMSTKYSNQRSPVGYRAKNTMSETELESLVAKMKQINKDIDEVSDEQMRQMITQGLTSKSPEESEGSSEDRPNKDDMDMMNIMKPVDRYVDAQKPLNDSTVKNHPAVTTRPPMTPSMLPRYPMPIPPARFSVSQMPAQQGLMSRMPQAFRSAMSSFGLGGQRRAPTGWNTPIGMDSISGQRFSPHSPYGQMPNFNVGMHPAFEALMYPKAYRPAQKEANPAYLGAINQQRATVPSRSAEELRSQMEKIMSEVERKGGRQNPYSPGRTPIAQQSEDTPNKSGHDLDVRESESNRGDDQQLRQSESVLSEVKMNSTTEIPA